MHLVRHEFSAGNRAYCRRCLGGKVGDFGGDVQTARKVGVEYTLAGANALIEHLVPKLEMGKKFRFVFCSGRGAEQDPAKSLWMMKDTRLIKVRPMLSNEYHC